MSEWCTIESDPGVFTELIKNIGVKNIKVDEILDMDTLISEKDPVYGLIFLFKYVPNSGYNPNVLDYYDPDLFFAKQVIENACATQAILAILLNNTDKIDIGQTLLDLKSFTKEMDPYMRGLSISNCEKIKEEHNKFARQEPFVFTKSELNIKSKEDVFHFVAYFNFKNAIYEIDGLREGPILIENNVNFDEWVTKVKPHILDRINLYSANEIKFNLLAIMPDKLEKLIKQNNDLNECINYINSLIDGGDLKMDDDKLIQFNNLNKEQLNNKLNELKGEMLQNNMIINDEQEKFKKYKIENERRQHNYIPLIFELLKLMSEKGNLDKVYKDARSKLEQKEKEKEIKEKENKKSENNNNEKK